jgi:hypothetical protein
MWLSDLARKLGEIADAIIPGDQSSWHQAPQPSQPTPQQRQAAAQIGAGAALGPSQPAQAMSAPRPAIQPTQFQYHPIQVAPPPQIQNPSRINVQQLNDFIQKTAQVGPKAVNTPIPKSNFQDGPSNNPLYRIAEGTLQGIGQIPLVGLPVQLANQANEFANTYSQAPQNPVQSTLQGVNDIATAGTSLSPLGMGAQLFGGLANQFTQNAGLNDGTTNLPLFGQTSSFSNQADEQGVPMTVLNNAMNVLGAAIPDVKRSDLGGPTVSEFNQHLGEQGFAQMNDSGPKGYTGPGSPHGEPLPDFGKPDSMSTPEYIAALQKAEDQARKGGRARLADTIRRKAMEQIDTYAPIEELDRVAGKLGIKSAPASQMRNLIDKTLGSSRMAAQFAKDNGLTDVLQKVPNPTAFKEYLKAKHAQDLNAKGIETGRNLEADKKLIHDLDPIYKPYQEKVVEYSRKLLDYLVAERLIDPDRAALLKERYPNYIPFQRIFGKDEEPISGNPNALKQRKQTIVRKIKGSKRLIEDPFVSLLDQTNRAFTQANRNNVKAQIAGLAQDPNIANHFGIEEVKPPNVPVAKVAHSEMVYPEIQSAIRNYLEKRGAKVKRGKQAAGMADGTAGSFAHPRDTHGQGHLHSTILKTEYGTPTEVMLHEFGHALDHELGLRTGDFYDGKTMRELNKVADLRFSHDTNLAQLEKTLSGEHVKYTHSVPEKIAEFVALYFGDRETAQKIAPTATAKFDEVVAKNPELQHINSVVKSRRFTVNNTEETIFRPSAFGPKDPHFTVLDGEDVRYFKAAPEILHAVESLSPPNANIVLRAVRNLYVRPLQVGAVGLNPAFVAGNVVRDQGTGFVNSAHGGRALRPDVFAKAFVAAITGKTDIPAELRRGGGGTTMFDMSRKDLGLSVKRIRAQRSVGAMTVYTITHPGELFRALEDVVGASERLGRYQQFQAGLDYAKKQKGWTEADQLAYATQQSMWNTGPFHRTSPLLQVANSLIPFTNASVQGTRVFNESIKRRPVRTLAAAASVAALPMALVTVYALSDPERKKAWDNIAEFEKDTNFVLVTNNSKQDEKSGRWSVIKVPIPAELRNYVQPIRRTLEAMHDNKAVDFGQIAADIFQGMSTLNADSPTQFVGNFVPQGLKPWLESSTNTNLFTGQKVVPDSLANMDPNDQYKPTTSGTIIKATQFLNDHFGTKVAPVQAENFISTSYGGLSSQVINAVDRVMAASGQIDESQVGGTSSPEAVSRRFTSAQGTSPAGLFAEARSAAVKSAGLSKAETDAYYGIVHPSKKDPRTGEDLPPDNSLYAQSARAETYLRYPKLFEVDRTLARVQDGPHDPIFDLTPEQAQAQLMYTVLSHVAPGELSGDKKFLKSQLPTDFSQQQDAYYNALTQKLGAKPASVVGGVTQPTPSPQVQAALDAKNYSAPGVQDYFNQLDAYNNAKRTQMGLPTIAAYKAAPTDGQIANPSSPYAGKSSSGGTGTKKGRKTGPGSRGGKIKIKKGRVPKLKLAKAGKVKIAKVPQAKTLKLKGFS